MSVAALGVNWQIFGSNGHEAADYSQGVLERFTRRAPSDWFLPNKDGKGGNAYIKSIVNPRRVDYFFGPHYAVCFAELKSINSDGKETRRAGSIPVATEKIVINHYYTKSREEFTKKVNRGSVSRIVNYKSMSFFEANNRNEVFDDGILKYRTARAENFSFENDNQRLRRVEKTLIEILTQCSPFDAPGKFFNGKTEIFLTCRAVAELLEVKIGLRSAEEYALVWIYQTFAQADSITQAELQQLLKALPEILPRPFPFCQNLKTLTQDFIIPNFCAAFKDVNNWAARSELLYIQKLLRLIK